jgi:elongation factor P
MNNETFEQINLNNDIVENKYLYLTSNQEVTIQMYEDTPIDLVLPPTVNLLVTNAEPAVKGDTVSSSTKSVTCETGLILNVPMFIEEDELIKVDTKNSSYMTRVQ